LEAKANEAKQKAEYYNKALYERGILDSAILIVEYKRDLKEAGKIGKIGPSQARD
jgi:hypothetical protein